MQMQKPGPEVESNDHSFSPDQTENHPTPKPPPLPARPSALSVLNSHSSDPISSPRPRLVSGPTTAISSNNIASFNASDPSTTLASYSNDSGSSSETLSATRSEARKTQYVGGTRARSDLRRSESINSSARAPSDIDAGSLLGEVLDKKTIDTLWHQNESSVELNPREFWTVPSADEIGDFEQEFRNISNANEDEADEADDELKIIEWRKKRKHFMILSQSGKPIWQRHGSDSLITGHIGAIQMIISFYENSGDNLKAFTAGSARFVILAQGPLYLVAISKLGESEIQLRAQLEALYTQILSTLTLPNLERMFSLRPSTDLRRPLQGTENLLSTLADSFTRGTPSTLLSSIECLNLRTRHRLEINDALLRNRCPELLYGLIVAGGKLVSVVRPKTHSLHPGDLQLLFNMLFEAEGIQAGGGESWIPMCLPGFNKNGFLYLYVSYIDINNQSSPKDAAARSTQLSPSQERQSHTNRGRELDSSRSIAILLVSSRKEAFFELQACRNAIVASLTSASLLKVIHEALAGGRLKLEDVVPGSLIQHFVYKSRENLQFVMPDWPVGFDDLIGRRRLMSVYENLHASIHARGSQLKVHHSVGRVSTSFAWLTDVFELYCVAKPGTVKKALVQAANRTVKWVEKEEEKIFIIGGAVF